MERGVACITQDVVAIEEPLEIRLDYCCSTHPDSHGVESEGLRREKSVSITMRTPGNDLELAAGFLFGEGILRRPADVIGIRGCGPVAGPHRGQNIVKVSLADSATVAWPKLERHFYATSSCGVCGKASLDALEVEGVAPIPRDGFSVSGDAITQMPVRLRERQGVFDQTGGLHAAALFDCAGRLVLIREDVGRHNAVDKLIGARFLAGQVPLSQHLLFLSGRASFELVQKAIVAGVPVIAAVGAPSSLAIELAKRFDVTLLGFVREGRFNIYHGAWRIQ
ncbi:MAG: formate dehydrogenase accessory sulfurtransferase FdhD [Pseudomonadota bacterium]|jgi:FdhD protein